MRMKRPESLNGLDIAPRPVQKELPVWIGVGGTPESAVNAGRRGLGMNPALLGGPPEQAKLLVELYRQAGAEAGHDPVQNRRAEIDESDDIQTDPIPLDKVRCSCRRV